MGNNKEFIYEMLSRIGDKWTLITLEELESGTLRFGELQRRIGKISQKMLTKTLKELEKDGLIERKSYPAIPPKVEYTLTELGKSLNKATCGIWLWTEKYVDIVQENRNKYYD